MNLNNINIHKQHKPFFKHSSTKHVKTTTGPTTVRHINFGIHPSEAEGEWGENINHLRGENWCFKWGMF
jgi:hypothetical protein